MPLDIQLHSVPLSLGIDTKNNPVLVDENRFVLIKNAVFSKGAAGQIHTRNGYEALPDSIAGGGTISSGSALAQLGNELDMLSSGGLYSFSETIDKWVPRALITPCIPSVTSIQKGMDSVAMPDAVSQGNVTVYAWVDATAGGVYLSVFDQAVGSVLYPATLLDSAGFNPRVMSNGTNIWVLWIAGSGTNSGKIVGVEITVASPTAGPGSQTSTTITAGSGGGFEAVVIGSNFGIAWATYGGTVEASLVSASSLAFGSTQSLYSGNNILAVAGSIAGNGNFVVGGYDNSGENRIWFLNPSTLSTIANYSSAGLSATAISNLVIVPSGSTGANFLASFPGASNNGASIIELYPFDQISGAGAASVLARSVGVASQPFSYGASTFALVCYPSTAQQTYFLMVVNNAGGSGAPAVGSIVGRYMALNAGPIPSSNAQVAFNGPAHISELSTGIFLMPVAEQVSFNSSNGVLTSVDGLVALTLDFTQTQVRTAQLGSDLTIAGGLPQLYDGAQVFENGFNVFPEKVSLSVLTSQIGFTAFSWNPATPAGTVTVTFPVNPDGSGFDGRLITPGEYLADFQGDVVWFTVDGNGSQPSGPGGSASYAQCIISSADSAAAIAAKFVAAWNGLSGSWVASATGAIVTLTATLNGFAYLARQFNLTHYIIGNGSSTFDTFICNGIAARFIQPGQYFTFAVVDNSGNEHYVYVWFQVGGVGTDPQVFTGNAAVPVMVAIGATDSEATVATEIANAINSDAGSYVAANTGGPVNDVLIEIISGVHTATNTAPSVGTMGRAIGTFGSVVVGQFDSYEFEATYEATDNVGQLHRSAPSEAAQIQLPAYGLGNAVVQISGITNLRLTARQKVSIVLWSTIADGTQFYRLQSLANNTASDFQSFVDVTEDAVLQGNELIYTTGGVVPNNCPPAFAQVVNFQDRLWLQDTEDLQLWWYSKDFQTGVAVEFSVEQTMRFDPIAGPTVAGIAMDANLIMFAQNGIWLVSGFGPDSAGNGTPFNGPTQITSPVGARDPGSLALIPAGVVFKTSKGYYLLDRGLNVGQQGINGNSVDVYAADVVVSAELVPGNTEVRFLSSGGTTLSYDWQFQQWSPFTDHQGVDSIVFAGNYYYLQSSGLVLEESAGFYLDNATGFSLVITTAWLKLSGIQGFQNLFKSLWQGFFPGTNEVQFQIAYDFNPAIIDTFVLNQGAGPGSQQNQTRPFTNALTYTFNIGANVTPGSIAITDVSSSAVFATDNGAGVLSGTSVATGAVTGTINYTNGAISFTVTVSPGNSHNYKIVWTWETIFPDLTQLRVFNSIMPCEAVQFTVQLLGPFWQSAKALALNALDLEVGVYKGAYRNLGPPASLG